MEWRATKNTAEVVPPIFHWAEFKRSVKHSDAFNGFHAIYWKNKEAANQNYVKRIWVKANSFNPEITGKKQTVPPVGKAV